jgi:hypothetical protein
MPIQFSREDYPLMAQLISHARTNPELQRQLFSSLEKEAKAYLYSPSEFRAEKGSFPSFLHWVLSLSEPESSETLAIILDEPKTVSSEKKFEDKHAPASASTALLDNILLDEKLGNQMFFTLCQRKAKGSYSFTKFLPFISDEVCRKTALQESKDGTGFQVVACVQDSETFSAYQARLDKTALQKASLKPGNGNRTGFYTVAGNQKGEAFTPYQTRLDEDTLRELAVSQSETGVTGFQIVAWKQVGDAFTLYQQRLDEKTLRETALKEEKNDGETGFQTVAVIQAGDVFTAYQKRLDKNTLMATAKKEDKKNEAGFQTVAVNQNAQDGQAFTAYQERFNDSEINFLAFQRTSRGTGFQAVARNQPLNSFGSLLNRLSPCRLAKTPFNEDLIDANEKMSSHEKNVAKTLYSNIVTLMTDPGRAIRERPQEFLALASRHLRKGRAIDMDLWIAPLEKALEACTTPPVRDQLCALLAKVTITLHSTNTSQTSLLERSYRAWLDVKDLQHLDADDNLSAGDSFVAATAQCYADEKTLPPTGHLLALTATGKDCHVLFSRGIDHLQMAAQVKLSKKEDAEEERLNETTEKAIVLLNNQVCYKDERLKQEDLDSAVNAKKQELRECSQELQKLHWSDVLQTLQVLHKEAKADSREAEVVIELAKCKFHFEMAKNTEARKAILDDMQKITNTDSSSRYEPIRKALHGVHAELHPVKIVPVPLEVKVEVPFLGDRGTAPEVVKQSPASVAERRVAEAEKSSEKKDTTVRVSSESFGDLPKQSPAPAAAKNVMHEVVTAKGPFSELLGELKTYRTTRESKPKTNWKLFPGLQYKKQDKLDAADFLIALLEKDSKKLAAIRSGQTIDIHLGALRQGSLGKLIRKHARKDVALGTVTKLVQTAWDQYQAAQLVALALRR